MALITQYTKCALCGELLGDGEIVATTHFIADRNDPLWRFSDAAMHQSCFDKWEHRDEFSARYEAFKSDLAQRRGGNGGR